ncbi:DNA cytosine methyltransferase [Candidatus Binatus sp.]|uniref:DNA cytosine methyltransferase n=1 Tax=Candidatus Binatus sp. TaxID=2811406 RepID=UPI003CC00B34
MSGRFTFYEFFAGGGMARLGLGERWRCSFANDICEKKAASYRANFAPAKELLVRDISKVKPFDLPGRAQMAWASFPCQDLSLAGSGAGLDGDRSGTFWPFWKLLQNLRSEDRAPRVVVLENVAGALTSHGGEDFAEIFRALVRVGYRIGPMVMDAIHFLPQSRPRLFVLAVETEREIPRSLIASSAIKPWHPRAIEDVYTSFSPYYQQKWIWWGLPPPPNCDISIDDMIEDEPTGVEWHTRDETARLLSHMSPLNLSKVDQIRGSGKRRVGFVYRRTRPQADGQKRQRAEVRFDGISGCLRTPVGGSSRQIVLIVERGQLRSRLLSPREAARLMGLPDTYRLPEKYNEAYHVAGDGVAVPVVRHLAENLLHPILNPRERLERAA